MIRFGSAGPATIGWSQLTLNARHVGPSLSDAYSQPIAYGRLSFCYLLETVTVVNDVGEQTGGGQKNAPSEL